MKEVELNIAQLIAFKSPQKRKFLEWGRGTGKTTYLGYLIVQMVQQMPRASFGLVGSTYNQILTRFLPAIKEGLEMFGIYENVDFVVGSNQGKKIGFELPFQTPDKWTNIIHFSNGCIFQLISLDYKDSGRGFNSYAIIGDEAALLDDEKLAINVRNTNRARKTIFKNAPLLNAEIFTSSTPLTQKGKWFTKMEEEAKKNPKDILFLKATAKVNINNLRPDYFEYMKSSYTNETIYNAEMLNIRPVEITNGFYAQLNPEIHYYNDFDNEYLENMPLKDLSLKSFDCRQDRDLNKNQPLIISVDWGASINTMTVSQIQGNIYRVLKSFYVKSPKILDHLFLEEFIPYYQYHTNKIIHFYYDRMGNASTANSKMTFAEQATELLIHAGWKVNKMTVGANPIYANKFRLINIMLKDDGLGNLPKIRINESNNPDLLVSLERAQLIETSRGLEKDKKEERSKVAQQQHTTHFSDTFDYPIYALFWEKLKNGTNQEFFDPMNF